MYIFNNVGQENTYNPLKSSNILKVFYEPNLVNEATIMRKLSEALVT